MKEIKGIDEIKQLVNSFYERVRSDEMLGPVFNGIIQDRWPAHLEKMYKFWQTVLLEEHTYEGRPFPPHAKMPIDKSHFDRWIALFRETIDANFSGAKAEEAKWRAGLMAELFQHKIDYIRKNPDKTVL